MQVDVPSEPTPTANEVSLETRKLEYIQLANGAQPRSPSSVSSFSYKIHGSM
jgi:hypothetical protein